jgi:hypothetical protein
MNAACICVVLLRTATGKYIRVELSPAGVVQGGHVSTYLLEKIRVVQQVQCSYVSLCFTACYAAVTHVLLYKLVRALVVRRQVAHRQ